MPGRSKFPWLPRGADAKRPCPGGRSSTIVGLPAHGAAAFKKRAAPKQLPTLGDMIRSLAAPGGFTGRNGGGEPGTQPLWPGQQRLDEIVAMGLAVSAFSTATQTPVCRKDSSR